jgi:hypothetical protein
MITDVLCSKLPSTMTATAHDSHYPASFFDDSPSKRALPCTPALLQAKSGKPIYLARGKEGLPANPGDLLWLMDRLFTKALVKEEIDLISPSVHPNSVHRLIATFCTEGTYKHHPHLRTFLAIANMAEMGVNERKVCDNALTLAADILRGPFTTKGKPANIKVNKEKRSAFRHVPTIGKDTLPNTISEGDDPELERDVEVLDDTTDNEDNNIEDDNAEGAGQQGMKRGRGGDEEDEGDDGRRLSKSSSKAAKSADGDVAMRDVM